MEDDQSQFPLREENDRHNFTKRSLAKSVQDNTDIYVVPVICSEIEAMEVDFNEFLEQLYG